MREMPNSPEKKIVSPWNVQNLGEILNICKKCPSILDLLFLKDVERWKTSSIDAKLRELGNTYHPLFSSYQEEKFDDEDKFNEMYKNVQNFLVELGKIFDEKVNAGEKWRNAMVDWFVKEMFKLNDSFYELNRDINAQKDAAFHQSTKSYEDYGYSSVFSVAEIYNTMIKDFNFMKEGNKNLWLMMYRNLLWLINKELEMLLGGDIEKNENLENGNIEDYKNEINKNDNNISEAEEKIFGIIREELNRLYSKKEIVSKEDIESIVKDFKKLLIKINAKNFEEKSKNLFIMDFLNIKSYEDFCDKYDILKRRQKDLLDLEKEIDEYFDEKWNLKSDVKIGNLHMEKLEKPIKTNVLKKIMKNISNRLQKLFS